MCNVHVIRFSVGFGKPLIMKRGKAPAHVKPPPEQEIGTKSNEPLEGTEFVVAGIPLGGYVKFLDEREGYVPDDQLHLAFNRKPLFQRVAIVAAGPIANFLLAIAAYWLLFAVGVPGTVPLLGEIDPASAAGKAGLHKGEEIVQVDDVQTRTWSEVNMQLFSRMGDTGLIRITVREEGSNDSLRNYQIEIFEWLSRVENPYPMGDLGLVLDFPATPAVIGGLTNDGAAKEAGILVNDKVVEFNGRPVGDWSDFVEFIQSHPGEVVRLSLRRDGRDVVIPVMPKSIERDGKRIGFLGASPQRVELPESMQREVRYPIHLALVPAVKKTWSVTVFTFESIGKMIRRLISPKNLGGPITIAKVALATAQSGLFTFISFIALLSISLGVLNLLPIPILDGGHLLFYLVEFITRRPVPERVQMWGVQMGVFVIVSIMLLAFYNDLMKL
jgi:regulator of sigma E protease